MNTPSITTLQLAIGLLVTAPAGAADPLPPVEVEVYRIEQRQQAGVLRASGLVTYKSETLLSFGAPGMIVEIACL